MDYKFLHKVLNQIVSETMVDYDKERLYTPFPPFSHLQTYIHSFLSWNSFPPLSSFTKHCNEVYGLNDDEIEYVWNEYKHIIIDKIENNG